MKSKFLILFVILASTLSCKNHYNDMIDWADNIPIGTYLDSVKKLQPNYIVIDWNKPAVYDTSKSFAITKIKGNTDQLNMRNTLNFVNEKYIGRFARK